MAIRKTQQPISTYSPASFSLHASFTHKTGNFAPSKLKTKNVYRLRNAIAAGQKQDLQF